MGKREQQAEERVHRRHMLASTMAHPDAQGRPDAWLIEQMRRSGHPKYSAYMLRQDKHKLKDTQNFTLDLIERNYSRVMGALDERLVAMESAAASIADSDFPQVTRIHRTVRDAHGEIIQTVDETRESPPDVATRLRAASLLLQIVKQRYDLYAGQNVHVAAAMLGKKFKVMESEIGSLRAKLDPQQLVAVDKRLHEVRQQEGV